MNRESLLDLIEKHLRDDATVTGGPRPIGEIVASVASEVRAGQVIPDYQGIISIGDVAAFVDGRLDESRTDLFCQAALADNSLLSEVVACLRSRSELSHAPDLPQGLNARLTNLVSDHFVQQALAKEPNAPAPGTDFSVSTSDEMPVDVAQVEDLHTDATSPDDQLSQEAFPSTHVSRSFDYTTLAVVAALVLVGSLGWWLITATQDEDIPRNTAQSGEAQSGEAQSGEAPHEDDVQSSTETVSDTAPMQSVAPDDALELTQAESGNDQDNEMTSPPAMIESSSSPTISQLAEDNALQPQNAGPISENQPGRDPAAANQPVLASHLQWNEIRGILAIRSGPANLDSSDEPGSNWALVDSDDHLALPSDDQPLVVRTLPQSKASAQFSGGRLVLAPDSSMEVSTSESDPSMARIRLPHGQAALMKIRADSQLEFDLGGQRTLPIAWETEASLVLQQTEAGVLLHVRDGRVRLGDESIENASILLAPNQSAEASDRLKTLPRWVNGNEETLPVHVLAQLDAHPNLGIALSVAIEQFDESRLSAKARRTYASLIGLKVNLADHRVLELLNSPRLAVRQAAFNRVFLMPDWDPRLNNVWRSAGQWIADSRQVQRMKRYISLARRGTRLNAVQVDELLTSLDAPESQSRVFADFLLRRLYQGGPTFEFDPNWTAAQRARAIAVWRTYVGRNGAARAMDIRSRMQQRANQP